MNAFRVTAGADTVRDTDTAIPVYLTATTVVRTDTVRHYLLFPRHDRISRGPAQGASRAGQSDRPVALT